MLTRMIISFVIVSLLTPLAFAGGVQVIYTEPGDTLLRLFGPSWQTVMDKNDNLVFTDQKGRRYPDKVVPGQRITIPAGAYLTPTAEERLSRYRNMQELAESKVREAETMLTHVDTGAEGYSEGKERLERAKELIQTETYNFINYHEAETEAQAAVDILTQAYSSKEENVQAEQTETQPDTITYKPEDQESHNQDGPSILVKVLACVMFGSLGIAGLRLLRNAVRVRQKKLWLERSFRRVRAVLED